MRTWARRLRERIYRMPAPPILRALVEFVFRVVRDFFRDDGTHMAAGVAYYAVFSLFPLLLGVVAVASFFFHSDEAQSRLVDFVVRQVPGLSDFLQDNIDGVLRARGAIGIVSLVGLFWSGRAVLGAVHRVINRAWGVPERPPFLMQQLSQLGIAIGLGAVFVLSVGLGTAGRIVGGTELLTDSPALQTAWRLFVNTLPYALGTGLFAYIYKYVTDVKVTWGTVLPGAVLAGTLFELAKLGFVIYLDNYANFDQVYGGISTVVVLMLWFYVVGIILVLGAEVSGEYGRSRASGRLRFRGQLRPVPGGLAPATHLLMPAAQQD